MYDITAVFTVLKIEKYKSISREWPYGDVTTHLEFGFTPSKDGTLRV